ARFFRGPLAGFARRSPQRDDSAESPAVVVAAVRGERFRLLGAEVEVEDVADAGRVELRRVRGCEVELVAVAGAVFDEGLVEACYLLAVHCAGDGEGVGVEVQRGGEAAAGVADGFGLFSVGQAY